MIRSYKELTIDKYLQIRQLIDSNEEDINKQVILLSILTDLDEEEILNLKLDEYKQLNQQTDFLLEQPKPNKIATTYKLGNYILEPMVDMRDVTTSQYIDFQTFIKDQDKYLVELLSIILIPKGKKYAQDYDIYDVQGTIKNNLNIEDALGLTAFFLTLLNSLIQTMQISCIRKMKKMMKKMKGEEKKKMQEQIILLEQNGVGLPVLTK